jgi:hypothetical protein
MIFRVHVVRFSRRQQLWNKCPVVPTFSNKPTHSTSTSLTMNLPPASNGHVAPHYTPHVQTSLSPQQPGLPRHDVSQPNSWNTNSNSPRYLDFSNNSDPFPLSAFPAFDAPQASIPGGNPLHPSYINDQSPSNVLGPTAIPPPQDSLSRYMPMPTNQALQATCACPTCVAHRMVGPAQFGGEEPALDGQNATVTAPSAQSSASSSRRRRITPYARPPALHAPMQYPDVIDTGSVGLALPTGDPGYARRPRRVSVIRNRRRTREVPLVRVEDRIEWVRRDVLKMTVWFNWSLDAEAKAHEPWGELPHRVASSGHADGAALNGIIGVAPPAPDVTPLRRSG